MRENESIGAGAGFPEAVADAPAVLPDSLTAILSAEPDDLEGDTITALTALGRIRLTKLWTADGEIAGYDDARNFKVREEKVSSIEDLSRLLSELQSEPSSCVVRGRFVGLEEAARREPEVSVKRKTTVRRNSVFEDQPLHAMMIDADGFRPSVDPVAEPVAAIDEYIRTQLPERFRGCSYHWQLSASAGRSKNAGVLKVHIWFWLRRPLTSAQVKAYIKANTAEGSVDLSIYSPVQVHYTASPIFEAGVAGPSGASKRLRGGAMRRQRGDRSCRCAGESGGAKFGTLCRCTPAVISRRPGGALEAIPNDGPDYNGSYQGWSWRLSHASGGSEEGFTVRAAGARSIGAAVVRNTTGRNGTASRAPKVKRQPHHDQSLKQLAEQARLGGPRIGKFHVVC